MKAVTKIFIAVIIIAGSWVSLYSQEDNISNSIMESEEIKTGHVFIDGKYVEPPYVVKKEETKIFINGNLVFDYHRPLSPFDFKQKPEASFDELNENSGLSDIFKIRDSTYNKPLVVVLGFYYLEKYEFSVACDSIAEFYKSLPNIKSFTSFEGQVGTYQMTSNNEESRTVSVNPFGRNHNLNFGPNSDSGFAEKMESRTNNTFEEYCSDLKDNRLLIFISKSERDTKFVRMRIKATKTKDFCNVIISNDSQPEKIDLLCKIGVDRSSAKIIIETFTDKSAIIKILEQTSSIIKKGTDLKNNKEIDQRSTPNNGVIMAWCPNIWENNFTGFLDDEILLVRDAIENQGYTYNENNIFTDPTYNDHDFGTCTYENLTNLANAGFLYIASHGFNGIDPDTDGNVPPAGIIVAFSDTEDAIIQWREGDQNIRAFQHVSNYWSTEECWSAVATSAWAEEHLASVLESNNTISILSTCHSHTNGWVDACAGGICFGYRDYTEYWGRVKLNNKALLERMNGIVKCPTTNKPIYREAHDAYNNMPFHYDEFTYSSNNFVRLCPAIESLSPFNQEYVQSDRTSGLVTIDSWCIVDDTHRAEDALTFTTTEGIMITNIYWVMEEGNTSKSRKLKYHWTYNNVESGEITVNVHPEFIVAYGGGNQQLDFDGTTPNGDQGNFKFFIDPNFSCGISVQPSTLVNLSNYGENELFFEAHCNDEVLYYEWYFEGGTPSTSNLANPTITYNNTGLFDVNLTITGNNSQSCIISKQDYIYVHDGNNTENIILSCDYSIIGDKKVRYYVYIDYVPEGVTYDLTLFFGDGYYSNNHYVNYPTTIGPIDRTFDSYGEYYSYVTISYEGETEILYSSSCGSVQVFDPNPCGGFTADFDYTPEHPEPGVIEFTPNITNCSGMCYWKWEFTTESNSNVYNDSYTQWFNLNSSVTDILQMPYPEEGNYKVKLTAYETQHGCPPAVMEKIIQVSYINSCWDPMYITSYQYNYGYPIDRILVKNRNCGFELRWDIFESLIPGCRCYHPNSGDMILYPDNDSATGVPLGRYHWELPEWSEPTSVPWYETDHYFYFPLPGNASNPPTGLYHFLTVLNSWGSSPSNMQCNVRAEIDVEFVDCDLTAVYIEDGFFEDAVNNAPYYSAGKFILDAEVNSMLNSENTVFTACNGIILTDGFNTGNKSFIATGEGFADCIYAPEGWDGWNYSDDRTILEDDCNQANLSIIPNPFKDLITIKINIPEDAQIQLNLYNINGQFIDNICKANYPAGLTVFTTDLKYLSPNEYFVEFIVNNLPIKTLKIIKQ
ncbi:MAG: hypothetical protein RBR97_16345 [Bacteroidales bacterium]|nr:hypothetical protein [Bacteroidales bacterium]